MPEITWEVKKELGIIGEGSGGWKKEVNLVSWNERAAKIDIRPWDAEHKKMGKGITLSKDEVIKLREILGSLKLDELEIG